MNGIERLWETDHYDECPAADVEEVCQNIVAYLGRRRITLGVPIKTLHRSILEYIWLRFKAPHASDITYPQTSVFLPADWTAAKEQIWTRWVYHVSDLESWDAEVMRPVFGTEERLWEAPIGTVWRTEIQDFLPWWVLRSAAQFAAIDPTPLPDPDEITAEEAAKYAKKAIDPYILEHGGRRARRLAEKEGGHS